MTTGNKIRYCTSHEIDRMKWNRCIEEAGNGLVYANTDYLDNMAGKWDALILDNYEAVMPLPWNKKYSFCYLYQPYFIPSLGVFGNNIQASMVQDFLMAIPKKFRYWDISLNETNNVNDHENSLHLTNSTRLNHIIHLNKPYDEIKAGYKRLCLRMLKKSAFHLVQTIRDGKPEDVIEFYRKLYKARHAQISPHVYEKLITVTTSCRDKGQAKIYLAKLPDGEITAAYLVLVDKNFVYSLIGGSSEKGKQTGSFYLLTDAAIKDHAGTNRVFRFEGSDMPGIALFDSQFGPEPISYQHIKRNELPFPVNLLKR